MISLNRAALAAGSVIAFHIVSTIPATARDALDLLSLGPSSTSLWVTRLKSVSPTRQLPQPRSLPAYKTVNEIALSSGAFELFLAETPTAAPGLDLAAPQTVRRAPKPASPDRAEQAGAAAVSDVTRTARRDARAPSGDGDSLSQSLWQLASKATRQWADIGGLSAAIVQNVRFEGEVTQAASRSAGGVMWAQPDVHTDIPSSSNMLNGYVDFDTGTKVTPYVGAGLGTVTYNLGGTGVGSTDVDSENAFNDSDVGYQGMAGLSYDLANNWSLSAEYRYAGALDYGRSYRIADDWDDTSHSARINFTKSFDLLQ